jgi:hypothetical protein
MVRAVGPFCGQILQVAQKSVKETVDIYVIF